MFVSAFQIENAIIFTTCNCSTRRENQQSIKRHSTKKQKPPNNILLISKTARECTDYKCTYVAHKSDEKSHKSENSVDVSVYSYVDF